MLYIAPPFETFQTAFAQYVQANLAWYLASEVESFFGEGSDLVTAVIDLFSPLTHDIYCEIVITFTRYGQPEISIEPVSSDDAKLLQIATDDLTVCVGHRRANWIHQTRAALVAIYDGLDTVPVSE